MPVLAGVQSGPRPTDNKTDRGAHSTSARAMTGPRCSTTVRSGVWSSLTVDGAEGMAAEGGRIEGETGGVLLDDGRDVWCAQAPIGDTLGMLVEDPADDGAVECKRRNKWRNAKPYSIPITSGKKSAPVS